MENDQSVSQTGRHLHALSSKIPDLFCLFILMSLVSWGSAQAVWSGDPTENTRLFGPSFGSDTLQTSVDDGAGGMFVTCTGDASGTYAGPFSAIIQHKLSDGTNATTEGDPLYGYIGQKINPIMVTDGNGGVFVGFRNYSPGYNRIMVAHCDQAFSDLGRSTRSMTLVR